MNKLPFRNLSYYGKILKEIGKGGYGTVLLTDNNYAIKKISKTSEGLFNDSALREIVILKLCQSDYVLPLIDVIIEKDSIGLIFPLASKNLTTSLLDKSLDYKNIIRKICLGLADIHNYNCLHLDIKEDNILLYTKNNKTEVWIGDPGIANYNFCAFSPIQEVAFSSWWRPLEIFQNLPPSKKSDIWALGIVIAEIILNQSRAKGNYTINKNNQNIEPRFFLQGLYNSEEIIKEILYLVGRPSKFLGNNNSPYNNLVNFSETSGDKLEKIMISRGVAKEEIDFVKFILKPHPDDRPDINDIINHPYLNISKEKDLSCYQSLNFIQNNQGSYDFQNLDFFSDLQFMTKRGLSILNNYKIISSSIRGILSLSLAVYLFDKFMSYSDYKNYIDKVDFYMLVCLQIAYCFYCEYPRIILDNIKDWIDKLEMKPKNITKLYLDFPKVQEEILMKTNFDLSVILPSMYIYEMTLDKKYNQDQLQLLSAYQVLPLLSHAYHINPPDIVARGIVDLVDDLETTNSELIMNEVVTDEVLEEFYKNFI